MKAHQMQQVFSLRLQCEDFSVATVRELLALPRVGSFDLMPQYIKAGGEPQKKRKENLQPSAYCVLFLKILRAFRVFNQ